MKTEKEIWKKIERIDFLEEKIGEGTIEGELVKEVLLWVLSKGSFPKGVGDSTVILR